MKIRYPAVEGLFYPEDPSELDNILNSFEEQIDTVIGDRPRAILVPHAGLIYSGLTATYAYKAASKFNYDSIAVFAPSHRVAFYGISCSLFDEYRFCKRSIKVNRTLTENIKRSNSLTFIEKAHVQEHSSEVQLPFIHKYLNNCDISVFIYGDANEVKLSYAISEILRKENILVVISSDLSHFHNYDECISIDKNIIDGISGLDLSKIEQGEACGITGIRAMVRTAKCLKLRPEICDYRNSGDITQDKSGVVGYLSAIFY